ncbi:hypothetical protein [Flavobacterium orientale]|nr:hypothetical protein [Flavobacterium orientale]
MGLFETGTNFINFLAVPFIELGLSYESLMLVFSWFGYVGFVYAYLFFKENITTPIKIFGNVDFLTLLLFLPNMHFWSVSLGKGSVIFMGIMMFMYAIKKPKQRLHLLLIASFFVYMVRPHIMFFLLTSVCVGILFGKERISQTTKALVIIASVSFLIAASNSILSIVNLENSQDVFSDFEAFATVRATELSKAGSGLDINSYPLPLKLFTFWFRPLFIDAPSIVGLFSSVENLMYLLIFFKACNMGFLKYLKSSPFLVKASFIAFLSVSFAMTFITSNLGIIMRQKAMVMYFGFFVIFSYLVYRREQRLKAV